MGEVYLLKPLKVCGRKFSTNQVRQIQETVSTFRNLSRKELALTICEHFSWISPHGRSKVETCLRALEKFEELGIVSLPAKQFQKSSPIKSYKVCVEDLKHEPVKACLDDVTPLELCLVSTKSMRDLWNGYIEQYHYLGYKTPFGPHLRYFIVSKQLQDQFLGCLLFAPAAWALEARDDWIGWGKNDRTKRLNLIVNNSRFLIFPWIEVNLLASKVLAMASQKIASDWQSAYGYRPVLLETFVDPAHFEGTCYKAANWAYIGNTTGRGRSGRSNEINTTVKKIFVFPLTPNFRATLRNQPADAGKPQSQKTVEFGDFWQKIVDILSQLASEFDKTWQKRSRVINTMLLILLIFRLLLSKNSQGYHTTILEFWDNCHRAKLSLPQKRPISASSFSEARSKLDDEIFKKLNQQIVHTYENYSVDFDWHGHRLFAVDGSKINLPRSLIEQGYSVPATGNYPQGLASTLYQLKSKIPYDFDLVKHGNERVCALAHFAELRPNDVVVYDRGYFSYQMLYEHTKKGVHAVFRLSEKTYKVISDFIKSDSNDEIVTINPDSDARRGIGKKHPDINIVPLQLRLIKYAFEKTTYYLGTTLIDGTYSVDDFSAVYHSRWGIEELYKVSKRLIDVEDFHGRNERSVRQELFAHFVLITLSRLFSNHGDGELTEMSKNDAVSRNRNSHSRNFRSLVKVNFKNCLATLSRYLEMLIFKTGEGLKEIATKTLNVTMSSKLKSRPYRSYPRKSMRPDPRWQPKKKQLKKAANMPIEGVSTTIAIAAYSV